LAGAVSATNAGLGNPAYKDEATSLVGRVPSRGAVKNVVRKLFGGGKKK